MINRVSGLTQMITLVLLDLFALLECLDTNIPNVRNSQIFSVFKCQPNDRVMCALDQPNKILKLVTRLYCGSICHTGHHWSWFNHIEDPTTCMMGECQLFAQKPQAIGQLHRCYLYKSDANHLSSKESKAMCADCSFPFTINGTLYNRCAPEIGCLTANRTDVISCTNYTVSGVMNDVVNISGQSVPVQLVVGWIIWMSRVVSVTYDWDFAWANYKSGFGSVGDSNYWLGLERVSQLTSSSKYRLRIEMKVQSTGDWLSAEYWSFTVGDEMITKYQLNVDGFSGDAGDGLKNFTPTGGCSSSDVANGMKFSTWDVDNDLWPGGNCAVALSGGGWWFNNCLCAYLTANRDAGYVRWFDKNGQYHVLAEVRMMMKPQ